MGGVIPPIYELKIIAMLRVSICLSDLPREKIKLIKGKKYIDLIVDEKIEPDKYGTHSVSVSRSQYEREHNIPKQYIGNGRKY